MTLAINARNKDLVTVLIENGADINTPSGDVRANTRSITVNDDHTTIRVLKILLSIYLSFNLYFVLFSPQGDTPLIMAIKQSMIDIVKLLLKGGADVSRKDKVCTIKEI